MSTQPIVDLWGAWFKRTYLGSGFEVGQFSLNSYNIKVFNIIIIVWKLNWFNLTLIW